MIKYARLVTSSSMNDIYSIRRLLQACHPSCHGSLGKKNGFFQCTTDVLLHLESMLNKLGISVHP